MKHAFLILAHDEPELLLKLLLQLDRTDSDIYLHIDKKNRDIDPEIIKKALQKAKVTFVPRHTVMWGSAAMIKAELALLRAAVQEKHNYYHLLSGHDLLIADYEKMDAFFSENDGCEFISFDPDEGSTRNALSRVRYYHLPQSKHEEVNRILLVLERHFISLQGKLRIDRLKNCKVKISKGSQWFDITHGFAEYVLHTMEKADYRKIFRHSVCGDELFMQTLLCNAKGDFVHSLAKTRCMDWSLHGQSPKTFTFGDYDRIMHSGAFFARKFSLGIDKDVIDAITSAVH